MDSAGYPCVISNVVVKAVWSRARLTARPFQRYTVYHRQLSVQLVRSWPLRQGRAQGQASESKAKNKAKPFVIKPFGTRYNLQKRAASDCSLQINEDIIISDRPVVHDLGVLLDSELMMKWHINQVARNWFYHIQRHKQIRHLLGLEVMVIDQARDITDF